MSDSPIHDLPSATTVAGTDVFPIDQGLVTRKATAFQVSQFIGPINVENSIHVSPAKTTPIDPDEFGIVDTADGNRLKKLTFANLKATLLAYFSALTGTWNISTTGNAATTTKLQTARNLDVTSFDGTTDVKIVAPAIHAATNKATPIDADEAGIWDSVSGLLNKVTWANIKATLKTYFDGIYVSLTNLAASGGSALVGFIQAGAGAVLRTMQSKAREIVSVTDFGAAADGITDDTAAFNAALTAAKSVTIPPGTYLLASSVLMQVDGNRLIGSGNDTILNYTGSGTALDFNGKLYCSAENFKITSSTAAIGIDCGAVAHYFRVHRVTLDGQVTAVPTGFTTAAIQIERSFYGEISHCDISYGIVGIYGFRECNGNFIRSNSVRQCKTGIKITDTTDNSDGNSIIGNEIESAATGSDYGIVLLGADSTMVIGNRIEYTVGTAHIHVNSGASVANFNQFVSNLMEGTIDAIVLGDGTGTNQVTSTMITGGRGINITINSDCIYTSITAPAGSYSGSLTDNGYGSQINLNPNIAGRVYLRSYATNSVNGLETVVGGLATTLDTKTNYLDIKGTVGTHSRFETNGLLRVVQGSVAAGGDSGGTAGCNTFTDVVNNAARSTGAGTIKFDDATARDNIGFIKFYVGTTAYYVPYFDHG